MANLDYKQDMSIDPTALDVEWLGQAELGRKYAKHAAFMRKQERLAKERVKVVRSELIRKCNEDPEGTTGKSAPTGPAIEAYYRTHKDHKKAKQEWIDAAYEADYAGMAQKEISWTRRQSLEGLVALHNAQYFAGPSSPRNLDREWKRKKISQATANEKVKEAMRRK